MIPISTLVSPVCGNQAMVKEMVPPNGNGCLQSPEAQGNPTVSDSVLKESHEGKDEGQLNRQPSVAMISEHTSPLMGTAVASNGMETDPHSMSDSLSPNQPMVTSSNTVDDSTLSHNKTTTNPVQSKLRSKRPKSSLPSQELLASLVLPSSTYLRLYLDLHRRGSSDEAHNIHPRSGLRDGLFWLCTNGESICEKLF